MTRDQIEIPLNKSKILLLLIGALAFVALGLWFIISPPIIDNSFWGNPTRIMIVGYASIFFFGLATFFFVRKLKDDRPGLIIDETGMIDNSSSVSSGKILWSDIQEISVLEIQKQKLIMIHVKNPQDYIDQQSSVFKRNLMSINFNMYGTPISITSNSLKISFQELFDLLVARIPK